jgi:hypothetical protein
VTPEGVADEPTRRPSLLESLAPYKWRIVGCALGFALYVMLWVCVFAGWTVLAGPLIALPVIVVLVGAGNLFQGWLGVERPAPRFSRPTHDATNDGDGAASP